MSNIALQIERTTAGSTAAGENVIFDTARYESGEISYNNVTGQITINAAGRYGIHWWVAAQTLGADSGVSFQIESTSGDQVIGSSTVKTGEVSGFGIIDTSTAPITVTLVNATSGTAYFASNVPVTASLMVIEDDEVAIGLNAYGGLYSLISQPINIPSGGGSVQIELDETDMPSENVTYGSDQLVIQISGVYEISYFISVSSSASAAGIDAGAFINGSVIMSSYQGLVLSSTAPTILAASIFETLNAGDVVTLAVDSLSEVNVVLNPQMSAYLTVKLISA